MTTRRGVLKLIGGGVVLAAAAGGAWYGLNGPSDKAREAWKQAGAPAEMRRRFLSYALLAPNPHNMQPWLVRLEGEDSLTLHCDLDRRLPETDPFDRQITVGCGAFLELLSLAAKQEGYDAQVMTFPEGEPQPRLSDKPVARVVFLRSGVEKDKLFDAIGARVTNRNTYDKQDVDAGLLRQLQEAGNMNGCVLRTTGEGELAGKLRDLTFRAHEVESVTHRTMKESVDVMRIGRAEVEKDRDGLAMDGQFMEFAKLAGMMKRQDLLDPKSQTFKVGMDQYREKAQSARAFAWLLNDPGTRAAEIGAGRAYARFALKAAELGLAVHPWSQSLQEYPEMKSLYDEVHGLIGEGRRIQMLVRVGHAAPVPHAPRRGLDAIMVETA